MNFQCLILRPEWVLTIPTVFLTLPWIILLTTTDFRSFYEIFYFFFGLPLSISCPAYSKTVLHFNRRLCCLFDVSHRWNCYESQFIIIVHHLIDRIRYKSSCFYNSPRIVNVIFFKHIFSIRSLAVVNIQASLSSVTIGLMLLRNSFYVTNDLCS